MLFEEYAEYAELPHEDAVPDYHDSAVEQRDEVAHGDFGAASLSKTRSEMIGIIGLFDGLQDILHGRNESTFEPSLAQALVSLVKLHIGLWTSTSYPSGEEGRIAGEIISLHQLRTAMHHLLHAV